MPATDSTKAFRDDYLCYFTRQEIEAVASELKLFQQGMTEARGYGGDDLAHAIDHVWVTR